MFIRIQNLSINYELIGNGESIILLHGWGSSLKSFELVAKQLSTKYKVYLIDLPGFGNSDEPNEAWNTNDYCKIVEDFIISLNIVKPNIIGHSFGGRIAGLLATKVPLKRLILVSSAGIKPRRTFKYYYKVYSYKFIKKIFTFFAPNFIPKICKNAGSIDYRNASVLMKKTLVKVVNEDIGGLLHNIKIPTLLIWGENDKETPLYQAREFEKKIPDSGLVILKDAGHYAHTEKLNDFLVIVEYFLKTKT